MSQAPENFSPELPPVTMDVPAEREIALWRRVRQGDASAMCELGQVSDALRQVLAGEAHAVQNEAAQSFAPVHDRLMKAIGAGRAGSRFEPAAKRGVTARLWATRLSQHRSAGRDNLLRTAAAVCVSLAALGGAHLTGRSPGSDALPVQSLVDDYVAALDSRTVAGGEKNNAGEATLSHRLGRRVRLPSAQRVGARLLSARLHQVGGRPAAQAHYLKNGVRVALYQIRAPHYGLAGLNETRWNRRLYFTQRYGPCRLVVWRADDDIMAMVSPFEMPASLNLAAAMRANAETRRAQTPQPSLDNG